MASAKLVSTSALAKRNTTEPKLLFSRFAEAGLIQKVDGSWTLTKAGEQSGGSYVESPKYGRYVGWPENFDLALLEQAPTKGNTTTPKRSHKVAEEPAGNLLTATRLGKHFDLSPNKCNYILSELGWVQKALKGWLVTEPGKRLGGIQSEDFRSGVPYVRWPEEILTNRALVGTIAEVMGTAEAPVAIQETVEVPGPQPGFRDKFPATHRAADGHFVRSRAEMLIDNWLYMAEIVHAYERKLPIEEDVYCDFYIPTGKVYIEFWGLENDPKYEARKKQKKNIYEKYGFNLIELNDADVLNLDDILPRYLLKYGVQAY